MNIDKAVWVEYIHVLTVLLVAVGYLSQSEIQYLADCKQLHRSHYILEEINIPISVTTLEKFQEDSGISLQELGSAKKT